MMANHNGSCEFTFVELRIVGEVSVDTGDASLTVRVGEVLEKMATGVTERLNAALAEGRFEDRLTLTIDVKSAVPMTL